MTPELGSQLTLSNRAGALQPPSQGAASTATSNNNLKQSWGLLGVGMWAHLRSHPVPMMVARPHPAAVTTLHGHTGVQQSWGWTASCLRLTLHP